MPTPIDNALRSKVRPAFSSCEEYGQLTDIQNAVLGKFDTATLEYTNSILTPVTRLRRHRDSCCCLGHLGDGHVPGRLRPDRQPRGMDQRGDAEMAGCCKWLSFRLLKL